MTAQSGTEGGAAAQKSAQRIGIMGGTFDPIHHGHLVAASEVAAKFDMDLVVFVPTGQPYQKADRVVSEAEDRYLMTVIATASNPRFSVSRVDIDRPGPTYTVDTLRDLRQQFPDAELFFITGADALQSILSWRDWEIALQLAEFVGVTRPGYELVDKVVPEEYQDRVHLIEIPAMAISSTGCRQRAHEGLPVWYLVPDGVVQYIGKRRLYSPCGSDARRDPTPAITRGAQGPGEAETPEGAGAAGNA
ncbi:nicotinate-nucleotide adenylyltransferase [Corynebacterium sp. 35RC1]|nr:nicotinate-nucleotide adenylyltransferase [Corynebacterium sp. 35RC1]